MELSRQFLGIVRPGSDTEGVSGGVVLVRLFLGLETLEQV